LVEDPSIRTVLHPESLSGGAAGYHRQPRARYQAMIDRHCRDVPQLKPRPLFDDDDETFGLPTVTEILRELEEKARPRPAAGLQGPRRLQEGARGRSRTSSAGMILEGTAWVVDERRGVAPSSTRRGHQAWPGLQHLGRCRKPLKGPPFMREVV